MSEKRCESNGCVRVECDGEYTLISSTETGDQMRCTNAEFAAFRDRVRTGVYDHIGYPQTAVA